MPIPQKKLTEVPKSAKLRVYEELKKWIVDGTLQPGEKIYDSEIAQFFSVSRTPVREAIQLLADQKLIEVFPGKESRVSEVGVADVDQIYQILASLHSLSLEFAFSRIDGTVIAQLKEANENLSRAIKAGDRENVRKYDQEFHDVFLHVASNDFLSAFSKTLECHIERIENLYCDRLPRLEDSVEGHKAIIDALENGDMQTASEAAKQNWLHITDVLDGSLNGQDTNGKK